MELHSNFHKGPLARFVIVLCSVLILFLVVEIVKAFKEYQYVGSGTNSAHTVTVDGEGDVFAVADIATFNFSVIDSGATVAEAQSKATSQMNDVLAALKNLGIADTDIKTLDYSVNPQYKQENQGIVCSTAGYCPPPTSTNTIVGYQVNQTVEVKVRDSSKAGDVLTKIGSMGVSSESGISFQIDDPSKLQEQARQKAIADAKTKAEELASDLGVKLGSITGFTENNNVPVYFKAMDSAAGAAAPAAAPLPQGQNKITSNVEITYQLR